MKANPHLFLLFGFSSLLHGETTITLDGATGSQSYALERSTNGGLTIGLGLEVEYFIVAGGGGGAGSDNDGSAWGGGGGGAGGVLAGSNFLPSESFTVVVGAGGAGGSISANVALQQGLNGDNSSFSNLTAIGGGGGGAYKVEGNAGGSGGGGGGRGTGNNLRTSGGLSTLDQGNNGGSSRDDNSTGRSAGGGGGGAGGPGGTGGTDVSVAGNGGAGVVTSITGTALTFAGGGGGGARDTQGGTQTPGTGGTGGGGAGSTSGSAGSATPNSGSGGGGAGSNGAGGSGGSGLVIVRYKGSALGEDIGGVISSGIESAAGYTLHTFSTVGSSNLDLSGINLHSRLGAVENGVISGSGDLTFTGPGSLTLNATNTYSGVTRVNAGTLALGSSGSIGSSSGVSIANGANFNVSTVTGGFTLGDEQTLSGGGTIAGDVTISGTHSPGFSPGIQVFADDLTYTVGSNVVWELIDNTVLDRGTEYDGVDVSGDLMFTGSTTITLDFALLGSMVDWTNEFWNNDYTGTDGWKIFDVGGEITGFENLTLAGSTIDKDGTSLTSERSGASFYLFEGANGVYLNYAAVPEPSVALLGGLGLLALLLRRR